MRVFLLLFLFLNLYGSDFEKDRKRAIKISKEQLNYIISFKECFKNAKNVKEAQKCADIADPILYKTQKEKLSLIEPNKKVKFERYNIKKYDSKDKEYFVKTLFFDYQQTLISLKCLNEITTKDEYKKCFSENINNLFIQDEEIWQKNKKWWLKKR